MSKDIILVPGVGDANPNDPSRWEGVNDPPEPASIKKFADYFRSKVKGQDRAIRHLVRRVTICSTGLHDRTKPLFVGLLAGPSGTGKTFTVETLGECVVGSARAITKIACAEYQEPHKIASLIGSPPGYVGFYNPDGGENGGHTGIEPILSQRRIDWPGFVTGRLMKFGNDEKAIEKRLKKLNKELAEVKKAVTELLNNRAKLIKEGKLDEALEKSQNKAFVDLKLKEGEFEEELGEMDYHPEQYYPSVILFDEIEKADPSVHRILLEIMDKGRLTLSNGMITDFTHSYILMTTNAGSFEMSNVLQSKVVGFKGAKQTAENDEMVLEAARIGITNLFPPEFLGRVGKNIIVFRPLSKETLLGILENHFKEFNDQLFIQAIIPLAVTMDQKSREMLTEEVLEHSEFGARRLIAFFDDLVKEPLARLMASNEETRAVKEGDIILIKLTVETGADGSKKLRSTLYKQKREPPGLPAPDKKKE